MAIITDSKKIEDVLSRGVAEVIDRQSLEQKLKSGRQLRIKFGVDPTSPSIHIGRAVPLLKLRDFQELGHTIVLVIGDFTGVIGDTSDKESERPMLTEEVVAENLKSYKDQVAKIIDIEKCEIHHNSEWLRQLDYHEIGRQADAFSLNEFISRENIAKRLEAGKRVSLRELLYPLMQGYDSVAVKADVEIGGTDQRFNVLAGRTLQRSYEQPAQDVVMTQLLQGLDGRKMSSSWGNTINIFDPADEMYGKIMSLADELVIDYFVAGTRVPLAEIDAYRDALQKGTNPRDIKMKLAKELVVLYHGKESAESAEEHFVNVFQKKEIPEEIKEVSITLPVSIIEFLRVSGHASSNSEARRLVEEKGVRINDEVVEDVNFEITEAMEGGVLRVGKRHFYKISNIK